MQIDFHYIKNELNRLNLQKVRLENCNWSIEDKIEVLKCYNKLESIYTKLLAKEQEKINQIEVADFYLLESQMN